MAGAGILGLVVGFLIGLTGMGGGAMMTPILVWTGWAAPAVAVGTDLVWNAITKTLVRCRGSLSSKECEPEPSPEARYWKHTGGLNRSVLTRSFEKKRGRSLC